MGDDVVSARRISSFGLNSPDAVRLADFYEKAFGARRVSSGHLGGAGFEHLMGVPGGAERQTLLVGEETIDILQMDAPGRPYPRGLLPQDTAFQHFALVVGAMEPALTQLQGTPGWTPISTGGPQRLPPTSGGVTAFKFRDPDGHPLELLAFPTDAVPAPWQERPPQRIFRGIDHSAISVRDTATSIAFYRSLGFTVTARTLNQGVEQANLDGVPSPQVEVTALALAASTPHLELLCYRSGSRPPRRVSSSNDVAATRIALAVDRPEEGADAGPQLLIDPDGHRLLLVR